MDFNETEKEKRRRETHANGSWKCSYEEYAACYCPDCSEADCIHRGAFRRVPTIDGGLGLCPKLQTYYKTKAQT